MRTHLRLPLRCCGRHRWPDQDPRAPLTVRTTFPAFCPVSTYLVAQITCSSWAGAMLEILCHNVGVSLSIPDGLFEICLRVLLSRRVPCRRRGGAARPAPRRRCRTRSRSPAACPRRSPQPRPPASSAQPSRPAPPGRPAASSPPSSWTTCAAWTPRSASPRRSSPSRSRPRAPRSPASSAPGPVIAATVIGGGARVRFATRDRFAACNGTAPIEVSSGNRNPPAVAARQPAPRPRPAHGRHHPDPPPSQRRTRLLRQESRRGKTCKEALRCLKRRISDAAAPASKPTHNPPRARP